MSSILEALKKLEEEKAARRGGMGNLAGKIAKTGRRQRQTPAWLLSGGMLAAALIAVLVTYFIMSGAATRRSAPIPAKMPVESAQHPVAPQPSAGTPVADAQIPRLSGPLPQTKGAAPPPKASANPARLPAPPPAQSPPEAAGETHPAFSVAGIAWQKDNTFRMAVVNGVPVKEGDSVEGTTVKEILPDRVRFFSNGKEFDVPMEK